jgi:hypothetical protein
MTVHALGNRTEYELIYYSCYRLKTPAYLYSMICEKKSDNGRWGAVAADSQGTQGFGGKKGQHRPQLPQPPLTQSCQPRTTKPSGIYQFTVHLLFHLLLQRVPINLGNSHPAAYRTDLPDDPNRPNERYRATSRQTNRVVSIMVS